MTILTGLDVLLNDHLDVLKNKRVGLLTNPTGVTRALQQNIAALRGAQVDLVALFSPEHGLAASAGPGEPVASGRDARTGLPIYSLYGNIRQPTREMLAGVDLLLFDLQDVGVRFYTFTTTLALTLEACAECGVPLIVLDRPNPINGVTTEGPLLDPALQSFVGYGPLPLRYGLTIGELARFYNQELQIGAELQVMALQGWRRSLWFDETGLTWVPPSPNMPHLSTAIVYPGAGLIEGTNLSVGRGTPLPFETAGAPWVAAGEHALAEELNALRIDGVRFRAIAFTPTASKFPNESCFGVQIHVTDREALRPVAMALHLISAVKRLYPAQFEWRAEHFDRLIGDASVRQQLDQGFAVRAIASQWAAGQDSFRMKRSAWMMYE